MGHKIRGSTKKYHEHKLPCAKRERLEKAYQDALQKKNAIEPEMDREVISVEHSRARQAKNQREAALKHALNIMSELLSHQRKHGCVGRSLVDPEPILKSD